MSWFWWWVCAGLIVLGVVLILAPVLGSWWARDFRPYRCPRCGRELIGSPPIHGIRDRDWCRELAEAQGEGL